MDVRNRSSACAHQRGLSLVELLIATALGLVIVAALTQLYANIVTTNREMAKTNSQIENARFAMQFLRNDIVHAGFWGGFVPEFDDLMYDQAPADEPTLVPDPCLAYASWTPGHVDALLGIGIQAYEGSPSTACNSVVNDKLASTDLLVVRHADTCVAGEANCDVDVAGRLYFQASNCSDVPGVELDALPPSYYSIDPNSYPLRERDCTTGADKRRFIQNIYYVRDYAVTAGDGVPTLVRSEFDLSGGTLAHQPAQALVQGIERFRVELGIDNRSETGALVEPNATTPGAAVVWQDPTNWDVPTNRGDGIPDPQDTDGDGVADAEFIHCTSASPCDDDQLQNVVAVKLYVLARADDPTPGYTDTKTYTMGAASYGPFNDGFKRHVFSTTVRINNVAGRRETP